MRWSGGVYETAWLAEEAEDEQARDAVADETGVLAGADATACTELTVCLVGGPCAGRCESDDSHRIK